MAEDDFPAKPSPNPKLLSVPSGLGASLDPVEGNPFPVGTTRHQLWERATRSAEAEAARIRADWMKARLADDRTKIRTLEDMVAYNAEHRASRHKWIWQEFQAWANRGVQVIFTDSDVRLMDEWLVSYADSWLELEGRSMQNGGVPMAVVETELRLMRDELTSLVLHWKVQARNMLAIREQERTAHADQSKRPGSGSSAAPRTRPTFPNRAAWLRKALDARKLTVVDLERQGGPHPKTTRKILNGKPVRETALEKLALGLSRTHSVAVTDIPND